MSVPVTKQTTVTSQQIVLILKAHFSALVKTVTTEMVLSVKVREMLVLLKEMKCELRPLKTKTKTIRNILAEVMKKWHFFNSRLYSSRRQKRVLKRELKCEK